MPPPMVRAMTTAAVMRIMTRAWAIAGAAPEPTMMAAPMTATSSPLPT